MTLDALAFPCRRCGKRYRTDRRHQGARALCPACGGRLRIPGRRRVGRAMSATRVVVLRELGLDPDAGEQAYWREQLRSAIRAIPADLAEEEEEPSSRREIARWLLIAFVAYGLACFPALAAGVALQVGSGLGAPGVLLGVACAVATPPQPPLRTETPA